MYSFFAIFVSILGTLLVWDINYQDGALIATPFTAVTSKFSGFHVNKEHADVTVSFQALNSLYNGKCFETKCFKTVKKISYGLLFEPTFNSTSNGRNSHKSTSSNAHDERSEHQRGSNESYDKFSLPKHHSYCPQCQTFPFRLRLPRLLQCKKANKRGKKIVKVRGHTNKDRYMENTDAKAEEDMIEGAIQEQQGKEEEEDNGVPEWSSTCQLIMPLAPMGPAIPHDTSPSTANSAHYDSESEFEQDAEEGTDDDSSAFELFSALELFSAPEEGRNEDSDGYEVLSDNEEGRNDDIDALEILSDSE